MALGTNFDPNLFLGGPGGESISAGTDHGTLYIFRMNTFLHFVLLLNSGIIIADERPPGNEKQRGQVSTFNFFHKLRFTPTFLTL